MSDFKQLKEKIDQLEGELKAIIIAHNYQRPKVQDIADFVDDSQKLSRQCVEVDVETIVFCSVVMTSFR